MKWRSSCRRRRGQRYYYVFKAMSNATAHTPAHIHMTATHIRALIYSQIPTTNNNMLEYYLPTMGHRSSRTTQIDLDTKSSLRTHTVHYRWIAVTKIVFSLSIYVVHRPLWIVRRLHYREGVHSKWRLNWKHKKGNKNSNNKKRRKKIG